MFRRDFSAVAFPGLITRRTLHQKARSTRKRRRFKVACNESEIRQSCRSILTVSRRPHTMQNSSPAPRVSRRLLVVALALLGIIGAIYLTLRLNARHNLEIFLRPSPVPSDLRVLHKRGTLSSSYYHFSGSPAVIDSIIQLKGLVEVPTEPPESSDMSGFSAKERTKVSWEW